MPVAYEISTDPIYFLELDYTEARSLQILIDNYVCGDLTSPISSALFDIAEALGFVLPEVDRFYGEIDPVEGIRFNKETELP